MLNSLNVKRYLSFLISKQVITIHIIKQWQYWFKMDKRLFIPNCRSSHVKNFLFQCRVHSNLRNTQSCILSLTTSWDGWSREGHKENLQCKIIEWFAYRRNVYYAPLGLVLCTLPQRFIFYLIRQGLSGRTEKEREVVTSLCSWLMLQGTDFVFTEMQKVMMDDMFQQKEGIS